MTNILPDVSGKIDLLSQKALRVIEKVASEKGAPFMLVGALARDILLEHIHVISAGRRTLDMDIGVLVDTWDHYLELTATLTAKQEFQKVNPNIQHRFRFKGKALIDIVPFGALADDQGDIYWPPDDDPKMSIIGFQEALDHSIPVSVDKDLIIMVASLPGLAMLKLLAWADRRYLTGNDVHDLVLIMDYYGQVNRERLFDEHPELLVEYDHDEDLAGRKLLGRDMLSLMSEGTWKAVMRIICGPEHHGQHYHAHDQKEETDEVVQHHGDDEHDQGDHDHQLNEALVLDIQRIISGRRYQVAEQYLLGLYEGLLFP